MTGREDAADPEDEAELLGTAWGTDENGRLVPVEVHRAGANFLFSGRAGEYRAFGLGFTAALAGAGDWLGLSDLRLVLSRFRIAGAAPLVRPDVRAQEQNRARPRTL